MESADQPTEAAPSACSLKEIYEIIRADFDKLPRKQRTDVRYLSAHHVTCLSLTPTQDLEIMKNALNKLINGLNWNKQLMNVEAVGPKNSIFRFQLSSLKEFDQDPWDDRDWSVITNDYPYASFQAGPLFQNLAQDMETSVPFVRADWFVHNASRNPIYNEILYQNMGSGISTIASGILSTEETNRDLFSDINESKVQRSGTANSGVSANYRVIERHSSPFGGYWISYDFLNNSGNNNIFRSPVNLDADAHEVIFNLPNGLLGFSLADGGLSQVEKAPTEIVVDDRRSDRAVTNAISCMNCHHAGIIGSPDSVRSSVTAAFKLGLFDKDDLATVKRLYPTNDLFSRAIQRDTQRVLAAYAKIGVDPKVTDPVNAISLKYEGKITRKAVPFELGLSEEQFTRFANGVARDSFDRGIGLGNESLPIEAIGTVEMDRAEFENFVKNNDFESLIRGNFRGN